MKALFQEPIENEQTAGRIAFTVFGTPIPQGSTRAFFKRGMRHPVITADNTKLKPWRQQITETAIALNVVMFDRDTPVEVTMRFYFTRPQSAKKRRGHTVKPDGDKLVRSVFDAITGVLIADDAQIVEHHASKDYGDPERVEIEIVAKSLDLTADKAST